MQLFAARKWGSLALCAGVGTSVLLEYCPVLAAPVQPTQETVLWHKIPIRSPQQKAANELGGEGSQWPRGDLAVSPADPNFLLLPIDVGGLYASHDGGATWNLAMNGWNARGANAFAIDPRNARRAIGVGGNSMNWDKNWGQSPQGLYLTTDGAASWTQTAARLDGFACSVAIDPTSFDAKQGFCTRAYYLSSGGELFRSDDGGASWKGVSQGSITQSVSRDWTQGGSFAALVRVDAKTGAVWISGSAGVFCSKNRGETFEQKRPNSTYGLDLASDGTLYASDSSGVWKSSDAGTTWSSTGSTGLDLQGQFAANVHVSPADSKRLLIWVPGANWNWKRYTSFDGGATWSESKLDTTGATLPTNARQGFFAWHPTNPNVAWSIGGDWISKSTDGGRTFKWSNNGYNGVMLGASMNFSAQSPSTVFLGFQDYNGAFSTDGGQSWNYRDISGLGWGGHAYGACQSGTDLMWYGDAEGWGQPRRLKQSRDGGQTWMLVQGNDGKPLNWSGADVSFVSPKNASICFASNWRTADKGATWTAMSGCDGVFSAKPDGTLIGRKGDALVVSSNEGATWTPVTTVTGGLRDVAFDSKRNRFFVASEDVLKAWDGAKWTTLETPRDQYGNRRILTVAVDAANPDVIYAGGSRDTYATNTTCVRSLDGGTTWQNLTTGSGAHEVSWIRVNPQNRQAWVAGQCYGMWQLDAPDTKAALEQATGDAPRVQPVALLEALPSPIAAQMAASILSNGDMSRVKEEAPEGWTQSWTGRGKIVGAWDDQVFVSAPASFRLEAVGGDAQGQSGAVFDAHAGQTFTISGKIKSAGQIQAQVALQPLRDNWAPIEFKQLKFVQNDSDWTPFSAQVTLPEGTTRAQIVLFIEGFGRAWLDDVKIVAQ